MLDRPASPPDLPALTSLRFVAAFGVLLLHYRDLLGPMPEALMRIVVGGQYGVTFFFLLSGFILTYRYQPWFAAGVGDIRYWRFQRLRLARIYPVYVLGLLLDTPWHLIERFQAGALPTEGSSYWASWLLNLVGLQAWVPAVPFAMFWNTPAWSVSAEFFFYATFPFVCAFIAARLGSLAAVVWSFIAVVITGFVLYAAVIYTFTWGVRVNEQTQYIVLVYNPVLRFSEFVAGCLLGRGFGLLSALPASRAHRLLSQVRWRNAVLLACLAAILGRVSMPEYTGPSAAWWLTSVAGKYAFFIMPFALIVLVVAWGRNCLSGWLEHRWMVQLGEASYALYIIHWSGVTFIKHGYLGAFGSPPVHAAIMGATVLAALVCYRYVEVPWRRRLQPPSTGGSPDTIQYPRL
jgi:peptidoglycan/LPS O-acetylase OafA/YrhL